LPYGVYYGDIFLDTETLELLMNQDKIELTLLPENRRIQIQKSQSMLEALINAGVLLRADCGGKGKCGKCRIQISDEHRNQVSPPTEAENRAVGEKNLQTGIRFACQVWASSNIAISIPVQPLLAP
jgi:ferredoxin